MWQKVLGLLAFCVLTLQPSAARAEGSSQRTWGWVAAGTGAAFLGVGTFAYFNSDSSTDDSAYDEYRRTEVPEGEDVCKYAAAQGRDDIVEACDGSDDYKTIFWVTMPIGFALAGTGVVLLATAPSEAPKAGWQLRPRTSPTGARIDLSYRF
jgi:predicted ribosomally synthesized peptide with SipW-like signal peptide